MEPDGWRAPVGAAALAIAVIPAAGSAMAAWAFHDTAPLRHRPVLWAAAGVLAWLSLGLPALADVVGAGAFPCDLRLVYVLAVPLLSEWRRGGAALQLRAAHRRRPARALARGDRATGAGCLFATRCIRRALPALPPTPRATTADAPARPVPLLACA